MDQKLTSLDQMRKLALQAVADSRGKVSELAEATANALKEMGENKQGQGNAVKAMLPAGQWSSDGTAGYPYYYDLAAEGVTANDRAEVSIGVSGLPVAIACRLCPVCETRSGAIRFRSVAVPDSNIPAEYWIEKGKE